MVEGQQQESSEEEKSSKIYLFRGIKEVKEGERIGAWWSENPYYSLVYKNAQHGKMFIASLTESKLQDLITEGVVVDASLDEYNNYFFNEDPENIREVTSDEYEVLDASTLISSHPFFSGELRKFPDDFHSIVNKIFGLNKSESSLHSAPLSDIPSK